MEEVIIAGLRGIKHYLVCYNNNNNNNNHNNNNCDNVYGAVIMTIAIATAHLVHLMNAEPRAPSLKPSQRTWAVKAADKWLLQSTSTIDICYYYSSRKLILILPFHEGWKAEST